MTTTAPDALWAPPARIRGTLAIVPGRGERAAVYERFGKRLSADGYTVAVFESGIAAATAWLATAEDAPRVLVGSDSGAGSVLGALARGAHADAGIIAGALVDISSPVPDDEQRTACPVHLGVLAETAPAASAAVVPIPEAPDLAAIAVPVLAVHGGADAVSPLAAAEEALGGIGDLDLVETVDGLHDALNDVSHRSVAATIVLFLERLRTGDAHAPVVRRRAAVSTP